MIGLTTRHLLEVLEEEPTIAPALIASTLTIPTPTIGVDTEITPDLIASTLSIPSPTVTAPASQTVAVTTTIASTLSIPSPSIANTGPYRITPSFIASTATVPTPRVESWDGLGDRLVNRNTGAIYQWPHNHSAEDPVRSLGRILTRGGKSVTVKMMRHHTHPGPATLTLHGMLADVTPPTQHDEFVAFFEDCDSTTFDYIDFRGDSLQVIISRFEAPRQIDRPDGSYFTYDLELTVVGINASPLADFYS